VKTRVRLAYQAPYDFAALLGFFAKRAIPGVESVDGESYRRVFALDGKVGALRVEALDGDAALALHVDFPDRKMLPQIEARVRRLFDIDTDIAAINAHLGRRAHLRPCVAKNPGQRLPGGWDGFEIAVRAVLGQQVTVAAARTLTERLVRKFGSEVVCPQPLPSRVAQGRASDPRTARASDSSFERLQSGKVYLFPSPQMLADADLGGLGITGARMNTLRAVAQALCDGRVDFRADQTLDEFVAAWTALPGIGAWTAHYIAMRALSHADAFPAADIVLRKAVARDGMPVATRALEQMAEAWRPYRAYAVLHLWRSTM
jgi:AraC family transcriptional regulator of adaptative response / DNA-3-methyladenine glycosylase II